MVREQFHLLSMGELMLMVEKNENYDVVEKESKYTRMVGRKKEKEEIFLAFLHIKNENFKQTHWCWKRLSRVALRK
jgi:putative IMPACT (imprinted ancient) family translation regulator